MAKEKRTLERTLLWTLGISLILVTRGQTPELGVQWFASPACNVDGDCSGIHFDARCLPYVEQSGGSNISVTRCTCNNDNKFYKVDDQCIFFAEVGETCDNSSSVCRNVNAVCSYDGDGYGVTRCQCQEGTRLVKYKGEIVCAYELTVEQDPDCVDCVMNHGICYDLNGNDTKDGCHCSTTLSGNDCEVSHVNVTCDVDYIHVCYLPHPHVDFSSTARLYVNNLGYKVGCVAALRPDICGPGQFYMQLPLSESMRDICRTKKLEYSGMVKYSNELVVQHNRLISSPEDIYFGVFCSFKSFHDLNVLGFAVNSVTETEVGQDIVPFLTLSVKTQLGQTVDEGTTFRVGDKVFFHLYLETNEGYSAMRVEFCTLSSSSLLPDSKASILPVLTHGCPAKDQTFLNDHNTWYRVQGQMNELETGLVQLIKLKQGSSLNMHCTIKLCIVGSESACDPVDCSTSATRRKRAIETGDSSRLVRVLGKLKLTENVHHKELDSMAIAAIVFAVLLLLTIFAIAILIAIRAKPRGRRNNNTQQPTVDPLETISSNYIAGLRLEDPPAESNV